MPEDRNQNSMYLLAEPAPVDVSAIERELEELWRGAAEKTGDKGAMLRAAAFTLVYAMGAVEDGGQAAELIAELALAHPSRAILLRLGAADAQPPVQQAWVTAYCHPSPTQGPEVCSEFITLECAGCDASGVASLLLSLRLSGLPMVLIWDATLPADHPLFTALEDRVERVITAAIPPCGPASSLEGFFVLRDQLGAATVTTDLAEALLLPWRRAVADLFDTHPGAATQVHEIHLRYQAAKIPAEKLLLAAWLSVALNWQPYRFALLGSAPVITFEHNHQIFFDGHAAEDRECVEFVVESAGGRKILRVDEPRIDNRLARLLLGELQIWGHDPERDRYLARARKWLKEILFS